MAERRFEAADQAVRILGSRYHRLGKGSVKSIFVGNLSSNSSENSIRSLFEGYGSVDYIRIVTDRITGEARGFAFVEMNTDAEGDRAMAELNGRELDGQKVTVIQARPAILGQRRPTEPPED